MFKFVAWSAIAVCLFTNVVVASTNPEKILSTSAISQSGRVAVENRQNLMISKEENAKLNDFIAYTDPNNPVNKILLGPVFGKGDLTKICENPKFLLAENISQIPNNPLLRYFKEPHQGCTFELDSSRSVIILKHPQAFVDQSGRNIKYIGIVADTSLVPHILNNTSFAINAENFYINLLQIGNAFSPFSQELNWEEIKQQGLKYIGNTKALSKGSAAAAKFYIPKLKALDNHSTITIDGLGIKIANVPLDPGIKKWQSMPAEIKKKIFIYSQSFHGINYGDISYIYIPAIEAFSPQQINKFVKKGRAALEKANINNSRGVIVDLRFNAGGDIKSMLLALSVILPEGKVFGLNPTTFVTLSNDANTLLIDDEPYAQYTGEQPPASLVKRNIPVAILTNWMTASSAEITALSLRNNIQASRLFGSNSSGALSTNATLFLWDGNVLNLMVDRVYDREGKIAPLSLKVDTVTPDDLKNIFSKKDATINSAMDWLKSFPEANQSTP